MLQLNDPLYFASISYYAGFGNTWNDIYNQSGDGGKFVIELSKRINPLRYIARDGEWSLPWNQELIPGFEMPVYDPNFSKSFTQVADEQAQVIKQRIHNGEKFAVMYSGGIDSTVIVVAMLKNLTDEELKSIVICTSGEALVEHPTFWEKYIQGKLQILDSNTHKYDDLIDKGLVPITADEGDCIFGTTFGLGLYSNYDYYISDLSEPVRTNLKNIKHKISSPDVHYSAYKDLLIKYLGAGRDPGFGKLLYEKYDRNIKTASVPVYSLHDFFWWAIFNVKYLNCAVRGALYFNDRIDWRTAMTTIVNWYSYPDFQRWSMTNNNNGQKIQSTVASYKTAAKDYIWEFDRNDWYRNFKIKLESLWAVVVQQDVSNIDASRMPAQRLALTKDYQMLYLDDPGVKDYFTHHITNYKIDWTA